MRISDWSSDVCSSDLRCRCPARRHAARILVVERRLFGWLTGHLADLAHQPSVRPVDVVDLTPTWHDIAAARPGDHRSAPGPHDAPARSAGKIGRAYGRERGGEQVEDSWGGDT